jgi:hypothetical protein
MAGRRTKYTPETVKAITDAISLGLSIKDACLRADVSVQTYARWSAQYVDFVDAIQKAESTCKLRKLARIEQAGQKGTWQADAWVLERKFPEEFAQRMTIRVTAEQAALLKQLGTTASEMFDAMLQEAAKVAAERQE